MVSSNLFGLAATFTLLQFTSACPAASPPATQGYATAAEDAIIYTDVVVIGGGSSGVYTAMGLIDAGKEVVVIEKEARLGGHAHTYVDPASGLPVNYGAQVFHNNELTKKYFTRLGVNTTLSPVGTAQPTPLLTDFKTGTALNITLPSDQVEIGTALVTYATLAASFAPYLTKGFNLPDDVPEDLLLPFGDFVAKYNLTAAVPIIFQIAQGMGDILDLPTIYSMMYVNADTISYIAGGFIVPATGKVTDLYDNALLELGENALLSSTVMSVDRTSSSNVTVAVMTPDGFKVVVAARLVMAIQPTISNLPFLKLTADETDVFSRFTHASYWPMVVNNTGIPDTIAINFYEADTPYNLPRMGSGYLISPTIVPGLKTMYYGGARGVDPLALDVEAEMVASISRLATGGAVATATSEPEVVAFKDHGAFCLQVSSEEIKAGFYKKMNALQGVSNTFWTGASWIAHDSSQIWAFTDALLPNITAVV